MAICGCVVSKSFTPILGTLPLQQGQPIPFFLKFGLACHSYPHFEHNHHELKKFSDVLNRMVKVDDKRNYILGRKRDYYTRTKEIFLQDRENKNNYKTIAVCDINKNFSFTNCLERINNFLESIYPQPKTTNLPRESILADIKSSLK